MNWTSGLLLVPALALGGLFVMERMGHEETRAAGETLEAKLAVTSEAQGEILDKQAELETQLATLKRQYESEVADLKGRLQAAELARDKAIARADKFREPDAKPKVADLRDPQQEMVRGIGQTLANAFNRPEMRERMRQRQLKRMDRTHAALFRKLGLGQDDIDTLKGLLADRDGAKNRAPLAFLSRLGQGGNATIADLQGGENEALADANAALKAFLGEDDYAALERYEETMSQRQAVTRVNKELAAAGQELSDAQSDKLIDLLHETQTAARELARQEVVQTNDEGHTRINFDFGAMQERQRAQNEVVMERVREEAFLNDDQADALGKQLDKQASNPFAGGQAISIGGGNAAVQIEMVTPAIEVEIPEQ